MSIKLDGAELALARRRAVALRKEATAARAVAQKAYEWANATEDLAVAWEKACELLVDPADVDKREG